MIILYNVHLRKNESTLKLKNIDLYIKNNLVLLMTSKNRSLIKFLIYIKLDNGLYVLKKKQFNNWRNKS